ncbi:MAG: hypothetical protein Q8Q14_01840 [Gemmatimonadales bacterium]|nr:hypothetical protein [Gemmatimonadales bacterium]
MSPDTLPPKPGPALRPPPECADSDVKCVVARVFLDSEFAYLWEQGWVQAVVYCESRWDPWAQNTYHRGLFQISVSWLDGTWADLDAKYGDWWDPEANSRMAIHILGVQGRGAWICSPW